MRAIQRTMKRIVLVAGICFTGLLGYAQDIHFSQYNSAPILLNPALTGVNGADYRLAANYRQQWTNVANYRTIAASYDMALFKKTNRSNYGGLGVSFFSDKAGDTDLSTNQVNLNLGYTFMLTRNGSQSLSTGIMGGFGHRSVDPNKMTFDSQFGSGGFDPGLPTLEDIETDTRIYADVGAGVLWNMNRKYSNYYLGFAATHLNQPNISFMGNADENLYMKLTLHGGGQFIVHEKLAILPSFVYYNQGPANQFNFGTLVKIKKTAVKGDNTAFYVGGWYRLKDAFIATARVDIASFSIGFSYDITLSKATVATRANGGPELSLIYTGFFPKTEKQATYCPAM